jgi:hypothetical protein
MARVADDTIETARDQRMPGLDRHQSAEPAAEHKDRPDPQRTAGSEENDAKPANGIAIESPELLPVYLRRQISGQQPDQPERCDHPSGGHDPRAHRAQISAAENSNARQHEKYDREGNQRRVGEEGSKPSPAEDREAEIGKGAYDGDER